MMRARPEIRATGRVRAAALEPAPTARRLVGAPRKRDAPGDAEVPQEHGTRNAAFYLFCAFLVSYFGRLPNRVPVLGVIHFDLLLAACTLVAIVAGRSSSARRFNFAQMDPVARRLWILLGYIVVTIPFVEWPGSALHNLEPYSKSVCFFFFVLATVDTTRKLKTLLAVYVALEVWRVLEPLYLHVTSGYWGTVASLGNWEVMNRLSGAPHDIINPNGLGFVVIITLPMLQFLIKPDTMLRRMAWVAVAGAMCYALVLSASRSSFLALVFLCLFVIWRSKNRAAWLAIAVAGAVVVTILMTGAERDRYRSIVSHDAPGAVTAEGRITGLIGDFKISLRRPLFGHGIGTSLEANSHFRNEFRRSHNLYTEAAQELGYVGLGLLLALIYSFVRACWTAQQLVSATATSDERLRFLHRVSVSLVVVVAVDLFFSFAAYGLSEPYWYFIGGLSVVTARLAMRLSPAATEVANSGKAGRAARRRARLRVRATGSRAAPGLGMR
jgi:putative inorganic carbon (hco3(-)) transporter